MLIYLFSHTFPKIPASLLHLIYFYIICIRACTGEQTKTHRRLSLSMLRQGHTWWLWIWFGLFKSGSIGVDRHSHKDFLKHVWYLRLREMYHVYSVYTSVVWEEWRTLNGRKADWAVKRRNVSTNQKATQPIRTWG